MTIVRLRILLVLFFSAWITSESIAQEESTGIQPITKSGSAAFEFDFGGLNTLAMPGVLIASFIFPTQDSTLIPLYGAGIKYYLSDGLALRGMVGFSTNTSGADSLPKGKTTGTFYGIGVGIEMHTHPVYAISPFFGAQVVYASGSSDNTTKEGTISTERKLSATGFGAGIFAGFDWYVFKSIAIGCEYELDFETASGSVTSGSTTTNSPSSTAIGIGSANVHLVIHL